MLGAPPLDPNMTDHFGVVNHHSEVNHHSGVNHQHSSSTDDHQGAPIHSQHLYVSEENVEPSSPPEWKDFLVL